MDWNSRRITAVLENALLEDRATRDATSYACIDPNQRATGTVLAKQDCILAGLGSIARILDVYAALDGAVVSHYEVTSHPEIFDGVRLHKGQAIAVIRHNARVVLSCERVILNLLQRLSGIATLTRKFVEAVSGTKARILDTRKTAPGLRMLDKFAVRCTSLWQAACRLSSNERTATGAAPSPLKWRSEAWRNWRKRWQMAAKQFFSTTWQLRTSERPSSGVRRLSDESRWNVPAELIWKTFALMPKPE
jgi:hypothetical protein